MSSWRTEHAQQLLTAYGVLRRSSRDEALADALYQRWYAARSPHASASRRWDPPAASAARAAHSGASTWSQDETDVVATGIAGVVVVATPRGRRALCRGEYVTTSGRPGFPPRVGDRVRPLCRLGAVVQDGWWRTWGEGWDVQHPEASLVRLYLHPSAGAVAPLVHAVTGALAPSNAWLLKVAPTPDGLSRPDAVVAYLAGPAREQDRDAVVAAVAGLTVGTPPPLTERLGEGMGWAEDPGTGESFGEVRCSAIATAYTAMAGEVMSDAKWLDTLAHEFRSRGIDPAAPHRSKASRGVPQ